MSLTTFLPRVLLVAAVAALAAGLVGGTDAATTPAPPVIAFGRSGGNIIPYTVSISPAGHVTPLGTTVGKRYLTSAAIARLVGLARTVRFFALPRTTSCAGTLPDVAYEWIRVRAGGLDRTVRVRGGCVTRFETLATALRLAVGLRA